MELNFRNLTASEIECKAVVAGNRIEVVLHNRASTCTKILNETVGPMNWEKEHTNGNKNCVVRIWDEDKQRMISKEDCGGPLTEVDGHKGQASNGFKRACALGWGLGLELYSQPHILLQKTDENVMYDEKGSQIVAEHYSVKEIEYDQEDKKIITRCVLVDSKERVVYEWSNKTGELVIEQNDVEPKGPLVIPDDADLVNDEDRNCDDDLPDNTDGFDDVLEDCATQPTPFGFVDYKKEFENEIKRTHVKKSDVLKALKIESFEDIKTVSEETLDETLRKLKAMKTYGK